MPKVKFDFFAKGRELKAVYKPEGFYFRIVAPQLTTPEASLFICCTPYKEGAVLNPKKEVFAPVESWVEAEELLERWQDWIKEEYILPEDGLLASIEKLEKLVGKEADRAIAKNRASKARTPLRTSPLVHLHPTVQQAVGSRFADGYYSDALHKACTALEKAVQDKASQPPEPTGATLMSKVFSKGKPVLTVSSNQGEQEGYMFLYRGLAQAIRNRYAHNDPATDPARALEWLGFISALFYKLDEAQPTTCTP